MNKYYCNLLVYLGQETLEKGLSKQGFNHMKYID